MARHETAWAEGLAQENAHQRELLALVRGEIGAFAKECAGALAVLDGAVGGLGSLASALETAAGAHEHASVVVDAGRRLRQLRAQDGDEAEIYDSASAGGDLPERVVGHARSALRADPRRSDRALLAAIVEAAGVRAQVEGILGPAPLAALEGLAPLARRLPGLAEVDPAEAEATAESLEPALAADEAEASGAPAGPLRQAAEHVLGAAKAVEEGRIRAAVREARKQLRGDLDGLHKVLKRAEGAPKEWKRVREREHRELTAEVDAKLERLERIGVWLEQLVPRLQLVGRGLSAAERARTVEDELSPHAQVTAEAARLVLLYSLATVWAPLLGGRRGGKHRAAARPRNRLVLGAAALVLAGAGVGIGAWVATSGGSHKAAAPPSSTLFIATTTQATTAPATTSTTAVIPVQLKLSHGPKGGDEFILGYRSRVPIKEIIYVTRRGTTSPGTRACTAKSYPAKRINCAVPASQRSRGTVPFYPEPPSKKPAGTATVVDTSGQAYGPFSVSFTG